MKTFKFILFISALFISISMMLTMTSCNENESSSPENSQHNNESSDSNNVTNETPDDNIDNGGGEAQDPENSEENEENAEGGNGVADDDDVISDDNENADETVQETFVYSLNSDRYHLPTCRYAASIGEEAKVEFTGDPEELNENGLKPCSICKPIPNYDYDAEEDNDTVYEYAYILNTKTMTVHSAGCHSGENSDEKNKEYSNDPIESIILLGYSPCQRCKPAPDYDYDAEEDNDTVYEYAYILNTKTMTVHSAGCFSGENSDEKNKEYSNDSIENILLLGYSPCQRCKPAPDYDYDAEEDNDTVYEYAYILNTETMTVHSAGCHSGENSDEKNKVYTNDSLESILEAGYTACKNCNP